VCVLNLRTVKLLRCPGRIRRYGGGGGERERERERESCLGLVTDRALCAGVGVIVHDKQTFSLSLPDRALYLLTFNHLLIVNKFLSNPPLPRHSVPRSLSLARG
jgi:hypothetical protein